MKIKKILILLIPLIIMVLIMNHAIFLMASSVCEKSEMKPFRYETKGFFGTLIKIETIEENNDGYSMFCIVKGNPDYFALFNNLNYIVENLGA